MNRIAVALALLAGALAFAQEDRAARLKHQLMAPCCWAEPVAAHNSPLAAEVRAEIDRMVAAGVPDSQIIKTFKTRYGERILAEPDGSAGIWLRVVPVVLFASGAAWVVMLLRRWSRRPVAATS